MVRLNLALDDDLYRFLKDRAKRGGCASIEQYVSRLLDRFRRQEGEDQPGREPAPLPRWSGRAIGELRREDIYGDAA